MKWGGSEPCPHPEKECSRQRAAAFVKILGLDHAWRLQRTLGEPTSRGTSEVGEGKQSMWFLEEGRKSLGHTNINYLLLWPVGKIFQCALWLT